MTFLEKIVSAMLGDLAIDCRDVNHSSKALGQEPTMSGTRMELACFLFNMKILLGDLLMAEAQNLEDDDDEQVDNITPLSNLPIVVAILADPMNSMVTSKGLLSFTDVVISKVPVEAPRV